MGCLVIFNFLACFYSGALYIHLTSHVPFSKITFDRNKYNAIVNGLFLPIVMLGVSGGIKLTKKWYLEQKESERLAKEKISRELQLLKTRLHPRFLFHSLHTIKKHISSNPSLAANLILHLSDLLSYILYESECEFVLLEKELEVLKSYINLERKSSKDRLTANVNISGVASQHYISPLLLLSTIENSFDYFLKDKDNDPTLEIVIKVGDNHLNYHLTCNRFLDVNSNPAEVKLKFIDLEKQLQYVYPGSHQIDISTDEQNINIALSFPVYNDNATGNNIIVPENELYELL
jgi:two-component system LytT family sensor kinase